MGLHSRGVGGEPGNTDGSLTVVAGSLQATSPTVIQSEGGFCSLASSLVYHMVLDHAGDSSIGEVGRCMAEWRCLILTEWWS